MKKNLSRNEIDEILDGAEMELLNAQYIALWKRDRLISFNSELFKLTGHKRKTNVENTSTIKTKARSKKSSVVTAKENARNNRSPCGVKCKDKEQASSAATSPETNGNCSGSQRTKRKSKEGDGNADGTHHSSKKRTSGRLAKPSRKKQVVAVSAPSVAITDEPTYCLCRQVSFGEMIGCDNDKCSIEWFHFECVQLKVKPKGKWYCPLCRGDRTNVLKPSAPK